jgi:uncharacterized protein (UPF0276 family)
MTSGFTERPAAGIGLRPQHHAWVIQHRPKIAWFEVHAENFMTHGPLLDDLEWIARDYPLSLHAVGLSLGSVSPPERDHLNHLRELVTRFEPDLVSDHLSWSAVQGTHFPDLLPLPYTEEALRVVIRNVHQVQDVLKREILLENPSRYVDSFDSALTEAEFLAEVVLRTGCGVLLDINNLYVSAINRGVDPATELDNFLNTVPLESFNEIHLGGHSSVELDDGRPLRLDDHGSRVCAEVWAEYQAAVAVLGFVPTLVEWDTRIPEFEVLQQEASVAQSLMQESARAGAIRAAAT